MLWNSFFEFFVKYVFGGVTSTSSYNGLLGSFYSKTSGQWVTSIGTNNYFAFTYNSPTSGELGMPLGNYFSLIATIISMVVILLLCCWFIKKIIAIIFRLFNGGNVF